MKAFKFISRGLKAHPTEEMTCLHILNTGWLEYKIRRTNEHNNNCLILEKGPKANFISGGIEYLEMGEFRQRFSVRYRRGHGGKSLTG